MAREIDGSFWDIIFDGHAFYAIQGVSEVEEDEEEVVVVHGIFRHIRLPGPHYGACSASVHDHIQVSPMILHRPIAWLANFWLNRGRTRKLA